ncbi:unnamed protein product [Urochloa humidicola]
MISTGTKELVLKEIFRMVEACEEKEDVLRTNRGQCALKQVHGFMEDLNWGTSFDESVLTWHYATDMLLFSQKERLTNVAPIVEATKLISNYMMFLLVEHPYMLPGRVRRRLYENAREDLLGQSGAYMHQMSTQIEIEVLQVVFGVWVEMLCYASHNCSRDSHARQLNIGGEFITVVWLLSTAAFNCLNCDKEWFHDSMERFFRPKRRRHLRLRRFRLYNTHRPTVFWA